MGVTAENVAEAHGVSRDAQDDFALESYRRAQVAIEAGRFDGEVVPIEVKARKGTIEFRVS
jgi:acetyl-CoA C-acetyltransferase